MVQLTGAEPNSPASDASAPDDHSGKAHRQLIGYIGLVLPLFIIALALWRDGSKVWQSLTSISAYYYSGANAAFVGMLVALALFLFTYRGYGNSQQWADRLAACIAGVAALLVAFFPTKAPDVFPVLTWWEKWVGVAHYVGAIVLFSMFAVFALWLFRKTAPGETDVRPDKKRRNGIYLVCGGLILLAMAWAGAAGYFGKPIFWPESLALVAFSVSWLVKGHATQSLRALLPGGSADVA
jgi:NADH:ubiquinone oxidoreductase subunit 6 (subunit J)